MAINLSKEESLFRNTLIYAVAPNGFRIDDTILNLCMLLKFNGFRSTQKNKLKKQKAVYDVNSLISLFKVLEDEKELTGFKTHTEAAELWLRTNLVNLVHRGKAEKESLASLRPIHLESYRIKNNSLARDYYSSDQMFLMLSADSTAKEQLTHFLNEGWNSKTNTFTPNHKLDVDSLGILKLIKEAGPIRYPSEENFHRIRPILPRQAKLYCEDIKKLLAYKDQLPRVVMMEYIKTLTAFHLSLYTFKIIQFLPQMIEQGSVEIEDQWNIVVDLTDNLDSNISRIAIGDTEKLFNSVYQYTRSTFAINTVLRKFKLDHENTSNLELALQELTSPSSDFETYFQFKWDALLERQDPETREMLQEQTQFNKSYFDKYINAIMASRWGRLKKQITELIDKSALKNDERGLMAQGRSRKHVRRFVLGTRLLETLVQIMLVAQNEEQNSYHLQPLSITDFISGIRERYGIIINGINEDRFKDADVSTLSAFKENVDALKAKLRRIGFFNDLSDAYLLQKIRPIIQLNSEQSQCK